MHRCINSNDRYNRTHLQAALASKEVNLDIVKFLLIDITMIWSWTRTLCSVYLLRSNKGTVSINGIVPLSV